MGNNCWGREAGGAVVVIQNSFSSVFIGAETLCEVIRWWFSSISLWLCYNLFSCRTPGFHFVFFVTARGHMQDELGCFCIISNFSFWMREI